MSTLCRLLELTLAVPNLQSSGTYSLSGTVLNIDGLDSQVGERYSRMEHSTAVCSNQYSGITAEGTGTIVQRGANIEVGDMDIRLKIQDIK